MNTLLRIFKHRLQDSTDAARALSPAALARIETRVRDSEQHHTGEICVCVEASLPLSYLWRGASARERAVTQFGKLKVWGFKHRLQDSTDAARALSPAALARIETRVRDSEQHHTGEICVCV